MSSYYEDQLKTVNFQENYAPVLKIFCITGQTNYFDLNKDSAKILVKWLMKNFPMKLEGINPCPKCGCDELLCGYNGYDKKSCTSGK
jgi:hypothetical protein